MSSYELTAAGVIVYLGFTNK